MVVIPILLSGMFLDIPNSLDAKRFPSAGDHFKYLSGLSPKKESLVISGT